MIANAQSKDISANKKARIIVYQVTAFAEILTKEAVKGEI